MRRSQASRKKVNEKLVRIGIQVPREVKEKWEAPAFRCQFKTLLTANH